MGFPDSCKIRKSGAPECSNSRFLKILQQRLENPVHRHRMLNLLSIWNSLKGIVIGGLRLSSFRKLPKFLLGGKASKKIRDLKATIDITILDRCQISLARDVTRAENPCKRVSWQASIDRRPSQIPTPPRNVKKLQKTKIRKPEDRPTVAEFLP